MTSPDYSNHFSLANIPFGVASCERYSNPQCATRLANTVIFLDILQRSGIFVEITGLPDNVFNRPTLNEFAALSKSIHWEVRAKLQVALSGTLPPNSTEDIDAVTLHLPISVGSFTDFSCSLHHVQNAGQAILNDKSPPPGFFNFPIGYNGRASSVIVSGTPVVRPHGHFYDRMLPSKEKSIIYGPSRAMDYELEIGMIISGSVPPRRGLTAKNADEYMFGMVILNDWSARDIQACEMVPLGPLNGKAFGTSISPWVVTLDALEAFKAPGPEHKIVLASHLEDIAAPNYDIEMRVELLVEGEATIVSQSNTRDLHWSGRQMCAHLASTGLGLQSGDILGTGTVSGPDDGSFGCLLEITKAGKEPIHLLNGSKRAYLQDGDMVRMTAVAGGLGSGVGFGECVGEIQRAF